MTVDRPQIALDRDTSPEDWLFWEDDENLLQSDKVC